MKAAILALGALALTLALASGAWAGKRYLITSSSQVKNGSLTGADIKNHSLALADLARGARQGISVQGLGGPRGPKGDKGVKGDTGPQGPKGDKGDKGASGVNSALVFGPYSNPSDADSGICSDNNTSGNDGWATDDLSYTYIVAPQSDGSFDVTKMFTGTYTTTGSHSPTNCSLTLAKGLTGTVRGDEAFTIRPNPSGGSAAFNPTAACPGTCSGDDFVAAFFPGSTFPDNYSWQFYYHSTTNGSDWTNADYGSPGNITG
jgi:hypothetical protein